jgi:hypothetical protein
MKRVVWLVVLIVFLVPSIFAQEAEVEVVAAAGIKKAIRDGLIAKAIDLTVDWGLKLVAGSKFTAEEARDLSGYLKEAADERFQSVVSTTRYVESLRSGKESPSDKDRAINSYGGSELRLTLVYNRLRRDLPNDLIEIPASSQYRQIEDVERDSKDIHEIRSLSTMSQDDQASLLNRLGLEYKNLERLSVHFQEYADAKLGAKWREQ